MKNLVCLFSKNHYDRHLFDLTKNVSDEKIYKAAKSDLDNTDIYTMSDFEADFNNNRPNVSPENFYIIFIKVADNEVNQWMK